MSTELTRQDKKLTGMERIQLERRRQINDEKFDAARDDQYVGGQLRRAAACYEQAALHDDNNPVPPKGWPWDPSWWKPRGILRNLEKAGALYQADLDRMDRKGSKGTPLIDFIQSRIQIIAEEIDLFLSPLPGDPNLFSAKSNFNIVSQMNAENMQDVKLIEFKRETAPLYFDEHLRRKLAVAKSDADPHPSGSILNKDEICGCDHGHFCQHRLDWLMEYLKRATYNLQVRTFESSKIIEDMTAKMDDLESRVRELKEESIDRDYGVDGDL